MEVLKINKLYKSYDNGKNWQNNDVNIEINDSEIVGFLGMNGAGKTTLLKSITGIHTFNKGSIEICGFNINKNKLDAKRNFGYVPDNHNTFEKLTGREYVNFSADIYKVPTDVREARISEWLKIFNLEQAFDRQIKSYSHGMKQKISIMAGFIHQPKLWLLDEPLMGLDVSSQREVLTILQKAKENGSSVFFSSHNLDVVERICDRAVVISNGRMIKDYNIAEFNNQSEVSLEEDFVLLVNSHLAKERERQSTDKKAKAKNASANYKKKSKGE